MPPEQPADAQFISLVIPVYNERDSLVALHAEIAEVAAKLPERIEVIFIDDGSKDDSWQVVRDIAAKDERVRGIKFRRNFGKAAALAAGFSAARAGRELSATKFQPRPRKSVHLGITELADALEPAVATKDFPARKVHGFLPDKAEVSEQRS